MTVPAGAAMNPIIRIENLSKRYVLGQDHTNLLSEKMGNAVRAGLRAFRSGGRPGPSGRAAAAGNEIWALRDVTMGIGEGEVVGIVGRNGAGKSTLLKVLSRITVPTRGRVTVDGRVGSLLEVGTGFHPELTGRENIFLNGSILGMKRSEIKGKFDQIVDFAEIEKFLDTPVKRYSSGMYVRLAFAVAAHLETEILIVDEVLAVGDSAFQKKCVGKMHDVSEGGRTVLFVSHNMTAIRELCGRAVWMKAGSVAADGTAKEIVAKYLREASNAVTEQVWPDPESAPGNEKVRLRSARLVSRGGTPAITVQTPVDVEFEYWNRVPGTELNLSLHLYNLEGQCIFNTTSASAVYPAGRIRGICHIPANLLNDGSYRIMIMIVQDRSFGVYRHDDVLVFEVQDVDRGGGWYGKWPGAVRPSLEWTTGYLDDGSESKIHETGSNGAT